jgi:hypothetical protein
MKTVLAITIHSFVDLITNSSSELFVCDGKKSLETVEEVILKLAAAHNEMGEGSKVPTDASLFEHVFKKPYVSKFGFDYYTLSPEARAEYETYHKLYCHPDFGRPDPEKHPLHKKCQAEQDEAEARIRPHEKGISEKTSEARRKKLWAEEAKIWKPWADACANSELNLFKSFLEKNGATAKDLAKVKFSEDSCKGRYAWVSFTDPDIQDAYETFRLYLSYNIRTTKGGIIIESASDNTIPWELMETVTTYLHAQRWHIG